MYWLVIWQDGGGRLCSGCTRVRASKYSAFGCLLPYVTGFRVGALLDFDRILRSSNSLPTSQRRPPPSYHTTIHSLNDPPFDAQGSRNKY